MRKFLLASIALFGLAATAHAADLPVKAPPMRAIPIQNWTGFYIGGHIGGAWRDDSSVVGGVGGSSNARFMGGGQVGADYQFWNMWVIGFEANYSALARNNDTTTFAGAAGGVFNDRTRGLFSATGRLGYAWGPALLYGKGGYAYRDSSNTFFPAAGVPGALTSNNSRDGYTLGGGLEYMFMPSWSAKIEYQHYGFDRSRFIAPAVLVASGGFRENEDTIKLGINYRFNPGMGYMR
jgi:outer membrane immunogenic protein